ncbi:MAG TPA: hypothetical protein PKA28_09045 [Methylomusa anaerophila]|nr:hypothetical protein [Methylomusa anaerophila]HML88582.1 hypothetical protein [Methylomusa anaerophila]
MEEYMYTYHYYRRRAVMRPSRKSGYIFHAALLSSILYITTALVHLVR